nr:NAD(P)-dependent oxidoreductase [Actinomycetota bacterium]NIW30110.1 2-hydroxy-3-oxopropionate reductase [Actinomycetota bacterium]
MAGGAGPDVARAEPLLNAIGSAITHVGDSGSGQTCKLVNQILVVVTML